MLVKGDKNKAYINALSHDQALSYFKGRFGILGRVVQKRKNYFIVERKNK